VKQPHWQYTHYFPHHPWPQALSPWLLERGSMTKLLRQACGVTFRLELIAQQWGQATSDECHFLKISPRARVLIREVRLCAGGEPWIYGRSLIPSSSFLGRARSLRNLLDDRPLGEILFNPPCAIRGPLQVAKILPEACARYLWSRRSVFHWCGAPLLVAETFLPALEAACA
jgi:chorismate--pyruvate lyase